MSGHSKWHNIQATKGKADAARGKIFTKIGREIAVAVKLGGPDPSINSKLYDVIQKAKQNNMPNDNIQRSIKKAAGGEDCAGNYDAITYEGYGSHGVAFIVQCLTDNRNRTAADVRHLFDKYNGSLGTSGSVTYMFDYKGIIIIENSAAVGEDEVMMVALDNGADDVLVSDDCYEILTAPDKLHTVAKAFESSGYTLVSSEVEYIPQNEIKLDKESAISVNKLIVALEDLDDVQNVYTSADLSAIDE
jgi:YebC/PmpR family DNA-binding regulatory protein